VKHTKSTHNTGRSLRRHSAQAQEPEKLLGRKRNALRSKLVLKKREKQAEHSAQSQRVQEQSLECAQKEERRFALGGDSERDVFHSQFAQATEITNGARTQSKHSALETQSGLEEHKKTTH
jgi:adenine-specific DNA methylase